MNKEKIFNYTIAIATLIFAAGSFFLSLYSGAQTSKDISEIKQGMNFFVDNQKNEWDRIEKECKEGKGLPVVCERYFPDTEK